MESKKTNLSLRNSSKRFDSLTFSNSHKDRPESFTRSRKLSFKSILQIVLRKSIKSLQLMANEWGDLILLEI